MAFQTGTQVNPAFGRTDYTPFLQGALQGAQAQGRGAENIAAGLAGLGQQIGQGLEKQYKEQKELKKEERGYKDTIASGMQVIEVINRMDIPDSVKKLLPEFTKKLGNPNVSLSEQAASAATLSNIFGSVLNTGLKTTMEDAANNAAAQYSNLLTQSGGRPVSPESGPISPAAEAKGREMYLKNLYTQSEIAKNLAAGNKPAVGQIMSLEEIENMKRRGFDVKAIPVGNGQYRVESVSPFAPPATTTIKTGDDILAGRTFDALKTQRDVALAATNAISAYEDASKLLKGKVITGAGAEAALALSKALEFFGIQSQEAADTEVLKSRLAQPVFSLVKQLGSGSGISNADRDYAEMAAGGKITLTKDAIIRLVEIGRKASQKTIDSYNQTLDEVYPSDNKDFASTRAVLKLRKPRTAAEIVGLPQ